MLVSQQQEAAPASLPHFLLSESVFFFPLLCPIFLPVFVQGFYALTCVVGKRGALAIHFLARFPAPTVEAVFSVTGYVWTLNLLSQTTLATVFSLTQATP